MKLLDLQVLLHLKYLKNLKA
jgi:hypothetical protein